MLYISRKLNVIGHKYGKLTILNEVEPSKGHRKFQCLCDCGNHSIVSLSHLRTGHTTSCGHCGYKVEEFNDYCIVTTTDDNGNRKIIIDKEFKQFAESHIITVDKSTNYAMVFSCNTSYYLHRFIMNCNDVKFDVDHINRDTLDNRKQNLRICTHQQNSCNLTKRENTTSKYRGIDYQRRRNNWRARITYKGKEYHLGEFPTEEEAFQVRLKAEKEIHKDFSNQDKI